MVVLYPFVLISQFITKIIKGKNHKEGKVTRADFSAMAKIGSQEGALQEGEFRYIQNILRFNKIQVKEIMTPRNVMTAFPEDMSLQKLQKELSTEAFSTYPRISRKRGSYHGLCLKRRSV